MVYSGYGNAFSAFNNPYQAQGPLVPEVPFAGNGAVSPAMASAGNNFTNPAMGGAVNPLATANGGSGWSLGSLLGNDSNGNQYGLLSGLGQISNILGGFAGIYQGMQAAKTARQALAFQKEAYERNYANQTKSYNTALGDRARTRGVMESQSQQQVDDYIRDNQL